MHALILPFVGFRTDLLPAYVRLLRDNEAEVRIAAAGKVTEFCQILNPELAVQHILPTVKVRCLLVYAARHLLHTIIQVTYECKHEDALPLCVLFY